MKAMIFAAGLGTRFKPWTDSHPKALAMVNGKSLLQRNIEYLQQFDIKEVIVNVHHFAEQVKNAINENHGWGSNVSISDESDQLLDTGGGLLKANFFLKDAPFLTINADILTNLDIFRFEDFHKRSDTLISLAVTNRSTSRNLLFNVNDRLCGWRNDVTKQEKISIQMHPLHAMAYSCVAIFQPEVFAFIKQKGKFSLTETYLDLADGNMIMGYDHSGDDFVDVGKPQSVERAEMIFT